MAYYSQGLTYIQTYVNTYYSLVLFPVALVWLMRSGNRDLEEAGGSLSSRWIATLIALFTLPYLIFVARVGGDFMFGRFLIPITGIMFFALEACVVRIGLRRVIKYSIAVLVVATVVFRWNQFSVSKIKHGIADEPAFYPLSWTELARDTGEKMATMFEGVDVRVAFYGMYAVWMYYSNPAIAIAMRYGSDGYLSCAQDHFRARSPRTREACTHRIFARTGSSFYF